MKKLLLLIGVILSIAIPASAEKDGILMTIYKKGHVDKSTTVHRAPLRLPIEVVYDSDAQTICVYTDSNLEGEVCLYHDGTPIDSSTEINVTFSLPFTYGEYTVMISGDWWEATAVLEL